MTLTILSFNSTGRPWAEWLRCSVREEVLGPPSAPAYADANLYRGEERFLGLIHFEGRLRDGNQADADLIQSQWAALPAGTRDRVYWLVYSGGGFWNLASKVDNVHFLRYEISRTALGSETSSLFIRFIQTLEAGQAPQGAIWETLYPSDNVNAATLMLLLSLAGSASESKGFAFDLRQEKNLIVRAHQEFAARKAKMGSARPPAVGDWLDDLEFARYESIAAQLREVLGAVPD